MNEITITGFKICRSNLIGQN